MNKCSCGLELTVIFEKDGWEVLGCEHCDTDCVAGNCVRCKATMSLL